MNPSASGWIEKFGSLLGKQKPLYSNYTDLYDGLKNMGFIYGLNVTLPDVLKTEHEPSHDELAKVNLLVALYHIYLFETKTKTFDGFINTLYDFYKELQESNATFWEMLFGPQKTSAALEKIIHNRVQIDDNILTKNFNKLVTNSLLFVDALAFKKWLKKQNSAKSYAAQLESLLLNITYKALNSKKEKTPYDVQLVKLFETSITYAQLNNNIVDDLNQLDFKRYDEIEKKYFLDLACLAVWDDNILEHNESDFIFTLGKNMKLDRALVERSLSQVTYFYNSYKNQISILQESNLVKNFYDNTSLLVKKLILRNKKRLQKELSESKELLALLAKATSQELTKEEREKVKSQLLDIFKSIPSLAIFALPGGAVLLPLFVKLIPNLLPSSFDENRVDETTNPKKTNS